MMKMPGRDRERRGDSLPVCLPSPCAQCCCVSPTQVYVGCLQFKAEIVMVARGLHNTSGNRCVFPGDTKSHSRFFNQTASSSFCFCIWPIAIHHSTRAPAISTSTFFFPANLTGPVKQRRSLDRSMRRAAASVKRRKKLEGDPFHTRRIF